MARICKRGRGRAAVGSSGRLVALGSMIAVVPLGALAPSASAGPLDMGVSVPNPPASTDVSKAAQAPSGVIKSTPAPADVTATPKASPAPAPNPSPPPTKGPAPAGAQPGAPPAGRRAD